MKIEALRKIHPEARILHDSVYEHLRYWPVLLDPSKGMKRKWMRYDTVTKEID